MKLYLRFVAFVPVLGFVLGVLYQYFYWSTLGLSYFSYVSLDEVITSSIAPITYTSILLLVVMGVSSLLYDVFGRFSKSTFSHAFMVISDNRVVFSCALALVSIIHIIFYYFYVGEIYIYWIFAIYFSVLISISICGRVYHDVSGKLEMKAVFTGFIALILIMGSTISFFGYRAAYSLMHGSTYVYFEGREDFGRYAGLVGDNHVFYKEDGSLFLRRLDSLESYTMMRVNAE